MPTYDYLCDGCGHEFELFQAITGRVRRKCPECGEPKLKRLIGTGGAVIFKGSGFYQTDYRSDSYKKAAEAEKKSAADKTSKKKDKTAGTESKSVDAKKNKKKAD
jgi:putative FmdB family regulatory protein